MQINRRAVAYLAAFLGSIAGPFVLYIANPGSLGWLLVAGILAFGLALGLAIGRVAGPVPGLGVAVWAFCGVSLLWTPVVVVSLGFALFALPGLVAYAALVALGATLGARRHRGASAS